MDENRVAGTARNVGGKVEEGFGRVTGDTRMRTEGLVDQAAGAAQDLYGQARHSADDAAGAAPIKIIVTSGRVRVTEEDLPEGGRFFAKPYEPTQITDTIREWTR